MIICDYICYVFMYVMYLLFCGQSDNMNLALNNRNFFLLISHEAPILRPGPG